jgi:hypothetical protein
VADQHGGGGGHLSQGVAIFIFGIAPAFASLAAGHWAFRPVDLINAVIVTLFGIPFLITYMVIER